MHQKVIETRIELPRLFSNFQIRGIENIPVTEMPGHEGCLKDIFGRMVAEEKIAHRATQESVMTWMTRTTGEISY